MLSFLALLLVINLSQSKEKKGKDDSNDIAAQLSYPLTNVDPDVIESYAESFNDGLMTMLNKKQSFTQFGRNVCAKGFKEGKVIIIIDGVEYKSLGQMTSFVNNVRDLFKTDSCKKSQTVEVETSVVDANTLKFYSCYDMVIDLDIGIYDASQNINSCGTHIITFDNDMDVITMEVITDGGFAGSLFNYVLQSTMTTLLPETEYEYGDGSLISTEKKLFANPIFVVGLLIMVFITLSTGLCIGFAINVTTNRELPAKEIIEI